MSKVEGRERWFLAVSIDLVVSAGVDEDDGRETVFFSIDDPEIPGGGKGSEPNHFTLQGMISECGVCAVCLVSPHGFLNLFLLGNCQL